MFQKPILIAMICSCLASCDIEGAYEREKSLQPPPGGAPVIPEDSVVLSIDEDGLLELDGQSVALEELEAALLAMAENGPIGHLILQADPKTKTGRIIEVRDVAQGISVDKVQIKLEAEE